MRWCWGFLALLIFKTIPALGTGPEWCRSCCGSQPEEEITSYTFPEGETFNITVKGDLGGDGCKFQFYQKEDNTTCCYMDSRREKIPGSRFKMCSNSKQPKSCNKRIEVYEVAGNPHKCRMSIFDSERSDGGEYEVIFPFEPESDTVRTINVVKDGLYWWEWVFISSVPIVVIIANILLFRFLVPSEKEEEDQRKRDEILLKLLKTNRPEELKEQLFKSQIFGKRDRIGKRHILGLRDRNHNNIFHLAAGRGWTEEMTKTLLELISKPMEIEDSEEGDCIIKKEKIFERLTVSSWSEFFFLSYNALRNLLLNKSIDLNSKNEEGNTPLIIASQTAMHLSFSNSYAHQLELIEMLVKEKKVKINIINDKGYTALHQAVNKKNKDVVEVLLRHGAIQSTYLDNGYSPLHTAVEKNSLDIVEMLVTDLENKKVLLNRVKNGKKGYETPLYLAVKSKFQDIARYLIEKDYDIAHKEDKHKKFYELVAGGQQVILHLLIQKGKLEWKDFNEICLLEAVNKNNRQAVNNILSFEPKPEITNALEKAKNRLIDMLEEERESTQKEKARPSHKMSSIIEKLEQDKNNLMVQNREAQHTT